MTDWDRRDKTVTLSFDERLDLIRSLSIWTPRTEGLRNRIWEIQPYEIGDRVAGGASTFVFEGIITSFKPEYFIAHIQINLDTVDATESGKEVGQMMGRSIADHIQHVKDTLNADNVYPDSNWSAYLHSLKPVIKKEN